MACIAVTGCEIQRPLPTAENKLEPSLDRPAFENQSETSAAVSPSEGFAHWVSARGGVEYSENGLSAANSKIANNPGTISPTAIPPNHPSAPLSPTSNRPMPGPPPMVWVQQRAEASMGLPIGLFVDGMMLMKPNGTISSIKSHDIVHQTITSEPFRIQDIKSLSEDLQREFGNRYRIRSAHPYLIVARPEKIKVWSDRFLRMHHSISLFCANRGLTQRSPDFPLIAIVLGNRSEFDHYALRDGAKIPSSCVGYYSQSSNRIVLYESPNDSDSNATLETICHEATHQIAFNTGLHQRLAANPLWIVEGFAVQFEAPSLCNYAKGNRSSNWPSSQKTAWQTLKKDPKRLRFMLEDIVRDDQLFQSETLDAYTVSWALSNYLAQRRNQQYINYLRKIGKREPFLPYPAGDRLSDFYEHFGSDFGILTRQISQHLDDLK